MIKQYIIDELLIGQNKTSKYLLNLKTFEMHNKQRLLEYRQRKKVGYN